MERGISKGPRQQGKRMTLRGGCVKVIDIVIFLVDGNVQ